MYFWELECVTSPTADSKDYFYHKTPKVVRSVKEFLEITPERMRELVNSGDYWRLIVRPISPLTYLFRKYLFCPSNGVRVDWERE